MPNLLVEIQVFNEVRRRIAEDADLSIDDEAVVDTSSGETALEDLLAHLIREALTDEAMAKACRERAGDMLDRSARLCARADKRRAVVKQAMGDAGMKRLQAADLTVTVSAGKPPLVFTREPLPNDPAAIQKVSYVWPKADIRLALERGDYLDFAQLGNPEPVLTVRTK
jgi:hypothetical protein